MDLIFNRSDAIFSDSWNPLVPDGVTYKEDKENVMAALQKLKDEGRYPQKLWEE